MTANANEKIAELLKTVLKKNAGKLFASGPFVHEGALVGDGLTILHTETIEEAADLMRAEPLIREGFRRFDLRLWELREGRMTIVMNASTGSFERSEPDLQGGAA